jgi:hypothetical protein
MVFEYWQLTDLSAAAAAAAAGAHMRVVPAAAGEKVGWVGALGVLAEAGRSMLTAASGTQRA